MNQQLSIQCFSLGKTLYGGDFMLMVQENCLKFIQEKYLKMRRKKCLVMSQKNFLVTEI